MQFLKLVINLAENFILITMKFKSFLLLPLILFLTLSAFSQKETKLLSPKKMKKDLDFLVNTLKEGHPDPFAKIDEKDFDALVKEAEKNISVELDMLDFYKNMSMIVASVHDGHSSVYLPQDWFLDLRKEEGAFPYEVYLTNDNRLFVIESFGDDNLPLGAEILEINGMTVSDFVETVTPYLSYELESFRNDRISRSFEFMLYLAFKRANNITFKYKSRSEGETTITTMPYREWVGMQKSNREEREKKLAMGEPYTFSVVKPGIGKLDILSFSVPDFENYEYFLKKTFKQIRKEEIHSLIIDVRGNYGGWPKVASELFHYIYNGYFKVMAQSRMKISHPYRRSYTDANPRLRSGTITVRQRRHFLNLQKILTGEIGSYVNESAFFNETPSMRENEFEGDCYLLIDRKSYSAASSFASTFQCYSMGYVIGEPTGGTKIFRANPFVRRTPATGMYVRISSTQLFTPCYSEENQPILPNVTVEPTILDRINKVDTQLNTALLLIKKIQKMRAENAEE